MLAELIATASSERQFPPESLPEIAFLGRSNVGKSSLLNCLVGQKGLAFTSSTPGRTQVINFYRVAGTFGGPQIGGPQLGLPQLGLPQCCFVDLPGYGYARVSLETKRRWKGLIEGYLLSRRALRLAILVIDSRRGWMDADLDLKSWLEFYNRRYLVVATKIDKLKQSEQHRGLASIRQQMTDPPLPFSAVTGRGVREIWQAISITSQAAP